MSHRRAIARGGAAWTPPDGTVTWLCAAKSGAVSAGGTWVDQSGNGFDYALNGNAYVDLDLGLVLDGNGAFAARADGPTLSSIAAWVWVSSYSWLATLVGNSENRSIDMREGPVWTNSGHAITGTWGTGIWMHVAATRHPEYKTQGYQNGAPALLANTWLFTSPVLSIGRLNAALPRYLSGRVDDVLLGSSVWDAATIADIYANSPGRPI